jgi:putative transposase
VSIYRFIAAEKAEQKVSLMCELLGVSRSGFYAWQRRAPCQRAREDELLLKRIRSIHGRARGVYGVRRVHAELRLAHDIRVGRKRVERLMREAGISGLTRRRRGHTTIRVPGVRVASDLVARDFNPQAPNRLWVADITYLPSWEGWLYLAAVQDAYSRSIVGWSMGSHMRAELVVDALKMALDRRRPAPGLIHHSDQGSQYVSLIFGHTARQAEIALSMGATGNAYDNALAETFFATLKKELVNRCSWATRRELSAAVFDYIETFYNPYRRHSTLGYLSPRQYERSTDRHQQRQLQTAI